MRSFLLSVLATAALLIGASAEAQNVRGRLVFAANDPVPGLRGFSVVLVQGDLKTGAASDSVPAAAAKALADLKDFLPYRNFRLLDTQWTAGSGHMTGRLQGPEGKEYDLELMTQRGPAAGDAVTVSRFLLREVGARPDRLASLYANGLVSRSAVDQAQAKTRSTFALLADPRSVIETTFSMDIGETVVVGTSRLQGDTALIVLLTAVSRTGAASRGR